MSNPPRRWRNVHPFPARMAPSIVFDNVPNAAEAQLTVLDPMAGSGTTLIVSRLKGHKVLGFDRDPLAITIATAGCRDIAPDEILKLGDDILARAETIASGLDGASAYPDGVDEETKKFIRFWFDRQNRRELSALSRAIHSMDLGASRPIFWCAFSKMIVTKRSGASLAADVSHSRPHKVYDRSPNRAFKMFPKMIRDIVRLSRFQRGRDSGTIAPVAKVQRGDARKLPLAAKSVDLVITSPPYLNAIDYLRGHKLSLVWMGYSVGAIRAMKKSNVGAERPANEPTSDHARIYAPTLPKCQRAMLNQYVDDMASVAREVRRVLKPTGRAIFVVGDCTLGSAYVKNSAILKDSCQKAGMTFVESVRRAIPSNRRYLPPPSASAAGVEFKKRMRSEVVLFFRN